jgi:ubiquinone biosynthesis protein
MLNLTSIPRLTRSLGRLVEIARTLTKYGLADALTRLDYRFVRRWTAGTELARLSTESREARIRMALTELGTTFIKFGQVLSTRPDLISDALAAELAKLQTKVPADPFTVTREIIESELHQPLEELFREFEQTPIASASIGQVHRAVLHSGRRVAVKVQHPDIHRRVADDLSIMAELAYLAEQYLPEFQMYRPVALVSEFDRVLNRELDFRRELRHLQLFRRSFSGDPTVLFPEPLPHLSTSRVLTMEYFEGIPFTRPDEIRASGGHFDQIARHGAQVFLDMIFRDGFFHADPHPGNIIYMPPSASHPVGAIGLLDAGMVGRFDDRLRDRFERGVAAIVQRDSATLTELIVQVGDVPLRFDQNGLEAEVSEQLSFYYGMALEQFQLGTALNDLIDVIRRYHIMLPAQLSLLLRVLVMLEGTGRLLAPSFNLLELLEPYPRQAAMKRLSPRRAALRFLKMATEWDDLFRALPRQAGVVLRMIQRQELGVQLIHRHLEPSVNRVVFGLMVSALFVGCSMLWAFSAPPLIWGTSVFGVAGCIVSAFLGYHLFRAIQHSGRLEEPDRLE